MFSIMWVTLCKHVTCTSLYVYNANALITFVEPDIGLPVGLGLGVPAIVITVVIVVACLIGYGKKNKFHAKTS